jgi:hypothetical protein
MFKVIELKIKDKLMLKNNKYYQNKCGLLFEGGGGCLQISSYKGSGVLKGGLF